MPIRGKMPACPKDDSSAEDNGYYALLVMLMFRPWRHPNATVKVWLEKGQCLWQSEGLTALSLCGILFIKEYLRWYTAEIEAIAAPYFRRNGETLPTPHLDSKD